MMDQEQGNDTDVWLGNNEPPPKPAWMEQEQGGTSNGTDEDESEFDRLWNYQLPPKPVIHLSQLSGIRLPCCSPGYAHPPPLNIMCPVDGSFSVVDWAGFEEGFQAWWGSHSTDPVNPEAALEDVEAFQQRLITLPPELRLRTAIHPLLVEGENFMKPLVGHPELCIHGASGVSFNGVAFSSLGTMLVGVIANGDQSMYPFTRLWAYMFLSSVSFGLVAFDDDRLALCMRDSTQQQQLRAHVTSREQATTLFKLGYLINLARNKVDNNADAAAQAQAPLLWKPVYGAASRLDVLRRRFVEMAKEMGVAKLQGMAAELEFVKVSSLQGMTRLHSSASCSMVRAAWQGKQVVLKIRDLTMSDRWEEGLRATVWEADIYMRLEKLQGRCIPRLYSLGFLHGGMFSFIMMSDCRVGDVKLTDFACPPEAARAAMQGSREALSGMHNRGILHGGLAFSNVVVSRRPNGSYAGMLVGFSRAKLVGPGKRHLLCKEQRELEGMLKDLLRQEDEEDEDE